MSDPSAPPPADAAELAREAVAKLERVISRQLQHALRGNMTLSRDALDDIGTFAASIAPVAAAHAAALAGGAGPDAARRAPHYYKALRDIVRARAERWARLGIRKNRNLIADSIVTVVESAVILIGMGPAALAALLAARAVSGAGAEE